MSQAAQEKREQELMQKAAEKEERKALVQEVYASEGLKKPPLKENRKIGWAALALALIVGILVISPIKLNGKRNDVIDEFKNGEKKKYTLSVQSKIRDAASESQRMKTAMLKDNLVPQAKMDELQSCINKIGQESDPAELVRLNKELVRLTNEVYEIYETNGGDVSGIGISSGRTAVNNMQSQIANLAYWESASSYNDARGSFPGNLLGSIYGIDYMPAD